MLALTPMAAATWTSTISVDVAMILYGAVSFKAASERATYLPARLNSLGATELATCKDADRYQLLLFRPRNAHPPR